MNSTYVVPEPLGPYTYPYLWLWQTHNIILVVTLILTFVLLLASPFHKIDAAYGRLAKNKRSIHAVGSGDWMINGRFAWWFMEAPTIYVAIVFYFFVGGNESSGWRWPQYRFNAAPLVMFCLYEFHYVQRVCIYPMISNSSQVSLTILAASFISNTLTCYLIMNFISDMGIYPDVWLYDPRFLLGLLIFLSGYVINRMSDHILISLRKRNLSNEEQETESLLKKNDHLDNVIDPDVYVNPETKRVYYVPRGWLFEYVSCANYFGEVLIWFGFALLTFSLEGLALFILTVGNLLPRALKYHRFYQEHFPNYPKARKALIPFVL